MKISTVVSLFIAAASCDAFGIPTKQFAAVRGGARYVIRCERRKWKKKKTRSYFSLQQWYRKSNYYEMWKQLSFVACHNSDSCQQLKKIKLNQLMERRHQRMPLLHTLDGIPMKLW